MRVVIALLAAAQFAAAPAFAQMDSGAEADPAAIEASMAAARAAAARPGDEALSCEALQAELGATMNDPTVQANIAESGAAAQEMQAQANDARNAAMGQMGANMALGLASAFVPGLGMAQQAMMMGQMAAAQRQAEANRGRHAAMMGNMQEIMPQLMRGQRLVELAQLKQCPFVESQVFIAPEAPPAEVEPAG
ncbi:MAG: hypothetical protein AB7O04_14005 [Hyphomonadaceae bacterium]